MQHTIQTVGTSEAARLLDCHPATVTRMVQDDRLHPIGRLGSLGAFVFDRSEVEALAQKRSDTTDTEPGEAAAS